MSVPNTPKRINDILEARLRAVEFEQSLHFVELRKVCVNLKKELEQSKQEIDNLRRRVLSVEVKSDAPASAPVRTRARKSALDGLNL